MLTVAGLTRVRTATRALVGAFVVILAISTSVAWARSARADSSGSLVSLTNSARAAAGLPGLTVSADLAAVAQGQAARMAATQTLAHTPNLPQAVCCWQALGENVGYGASPAVIQAAFMASPEHRANILNSGYTQIGIGAVTDAHGILWVSEIFRRPTSPAPAPQPRPQPVATHTVTPPVTTAPSTPARPSTEAARSTRSSTRVPLPSTFDPAAAGLAAGGRASRALQDGRLPLSAAQRLAAQLSASSVAADPDPVSRLIGFVDDAVEAPS